MNDIMFQLTLRRLRPPQPTGEIPTLYGNALSAACNTAEQVGSTKVPTAIIRKTALAFVACDKVSRFAAESDIAFPNSLRRVRGQEKKEYHLAMSFCDRHAFSHWHMDYLGAYEHPLTEKILHEYKQRKEASRPLWCYTHCPGAKPFRAKAVVRHTSERVVRAALWRALREAGYDRSGRSLDGTKKEFRGTIRIVISRPVDLLKIQFDRLVEYLTKLISHIGLPQPGPSSERPDTH